MFHTRVSYQMWVRETFFQCLAIIPWSVIGQIFGQMSSIGRCTTWIRNMSHTHVISKGFFWSLWVPNMWKEKSIKSNFTIFVKLIRPGNSQNWLTLYVNCEQSLFNMLQSSHITWTFEALLGGEQAWTPKFYLKSFVMDSVQVGKALFVKESYTTLGIEPKT